MLRARSKNWPALVVLAGLLAGPHAIAQEKPKDAAAPAQAKPDGAVAAKDAKKEPDAPKPRVAVFRLAGPVQETPEEEVFNFGGETGIPLETLVSRMDKAAKDSSVKAVVILLEQPTVGSAQVEELTAAADDTIKAVVLRVDSPGGSALASEIILDATRRVKAKKPFTVSRGNVAGSGGYYVACGSDTIFADETTITGSIGVVAGKLATSGLYDKLGVTFKSYRRGQNAGMLASSEVFTPGERLKMRSWMDEIYGVFKGHVTAIRGNRLKKPIDDLAGGRVYTGKQALELSLVDRLGTLHDAVKHVAAQAKLTDYDVRVVPKPKSFLEKLLEGGVDNDSRKGLDVVHKPTLLELAQPYLRSLDPSRAELVRNALGCLELLNREGVILMMPELGLGR